MQGMVLSMLTLLSKKSVIKGKRELGLKGTCIYNFFLQKTLLDITPKGMKIGFWGEEQYITMCCVPAKFSSI